MILSLSLNGGGVGALERVLFMMGFIGVGVGSMCDMYD